MVQAALCVMIAIGRTYRAAPEGRQVERKDLAKADVSGAVSRLRPTSLKADRQSWGSCSKMLHRV